MGYLKSIRGKVQATVASESDSASRVKITISEMNPGLVVLTIRHDLGPFRSCSSCELKLNEHDLKEMPSSRTRVRNLNGRDLGLPLEGTVEVTYFDEKRRPRLCNFCVPIGRMASEAFSRNEGSDGIYWNCGEITRKRKGRRP